MSKPISPDEIGAFKQKLFPPFVFEAINELIAENYINGSANVLQKEIVGRISTKMDGESYESNKKKIYASGWLNFEEAYRAAGWTVSYDKPAYNESYDANFDFRRK